nr:reverse transcriptase domain-containing protein [Tanacetum cinerariifolium]
MLKALLSNMEKLQELVNTPLNENCSAVILKKLPEKLGDPGKFLIPCGFSELKCKALADLGASINLMPLSVWKKLGLPDLIPTQMTLKLAKRAICTPDGIARDVFVPVGNFTFPADFVVVDYESDPRVPLILGRPLLRTARALIDVHGEEMILRDGDERLTLNMKHDTTSYSNHPYRESVNLINIFNLSSEDCLKDLVSNKQSGNPTFSLHKEIASPEVIHKFNDSKGGNFLSKELPDIDSFNDVHSHFDDDPLSGSTTYSANSLLEEAFQVTADVPEIYMQEFWATAKLHHNSILFKIDTKKSVLDLEAFREMLHISPRILSQSFAEFPYEEEILEFLSKAYKEYYACATGEATPKPKASTRKKKDDFASSTTPPTLTPTTTVVSALRL